MTSASSTARAPPTATTPAAAGRCVARSPRVAAVRCATSALAAADRLAVMIRANAPAPFLPTHLARCPDCPPGARETIIDSMMNIGLLAWARGAPAVPATRDWQQPTHARSPAS